jgi:hypothetical protein
MTFQLSLSNGARLRLIAINGVLFAVLKCRERQTRHRPPAEKTSGLSSDTAEYKSSQVTRLRMPNKWHICKDGQAGNKKRQRRGLLVFSELPSLPSPAADRAVSILTWVVSRGRSYGLLWADSIIQKNVRKDDATPAYSPVSDR